ncbi:CD225/dispanin family protein [Arenimonas sp.]|uniref:CD225/dispanin family protein n=1 Tax=Arenimonas sp. TaxID=1872635 RepID=UPI0025BAE2C3|nr:CD225/dispanin family protein [Arenimonas sp.]
MAAPPPAAPRPYVPNHLVWAILATLFCCLPGGIVAIVYAARVDGKVAAGDIAGARSDSDNAKLWSLISIGIPLAFGVLWLLFVLFAAMTGAMAG